MEHVEMLSAIDDAFDHVEMLTAIDEAFEHVESLRGSSMFHGDAQPEIISALDDAMVHVDMLTAIDEAFEHVDMLTADDSDNELDMIFANDATSLYYKSFQPYQCKYWTPERK